MQANHQACQDSAVLVLLSYRLSSWLCRNVTNVYCQHPMERYRSNEHFVSVVVAGGIRLSLKVLNNLSCTVLRLASISHSHFWGHQPHLKLIFKKWRIVRVSLLTVADWRTFCDFESAHRVYIIWEVFDQCYYCSGRQFSDKFFSTKHRISFSITPELQWRLLFS